ncbi:MAG: peptidoglycan editing factor PgeF [Roseibium sp.]
MKLEAEDLKLGGFQHGFFTRQGGVSEGIYESLNIGLGSNDVRENVLENRQRIAEALSTDLNRLVSPYQIHSSDVIVLDKPWAEGANRKADALVTRTPGLALAIATADCGPVLFADPDARIIGAAHSGWKGAITGILENTVTAMESLGSNRQNIIAVLGPTISQNAYEVGPEFYERFAAENTKNTRYFIPSDRPGHYLFDLQNFIIDDLNRLGLAKVSNLGLCTYSDEKLFFSYRRTTHRKEPDYGRQFSAIVLK